MQLQNLGHTVDSIQNVDLIFLITDHYKMAAGIVLLLTYGINMLMC